MFTYKNKELTLTKHGHILATFIAQVSSDSQNIMEMLQQLLNQMMPLNFGATLSISQYVMPHILAKVMKTHPHTPLSMIVENTEILLQYLEEGKIQFALIEGLFDKNMYQTFPFSKESFIAVCSPYSNLGNKKYKLQDLTCQNLILREKGSGTRAICDTILRYHNLSLSDFHQTVEIGNMEAIKQLVKQNLGITFMYKVSVRKELQEGSLQEIIIDDLNVEREFNFVCLKQTLNKSYYQAWFHYFKDEYNYVAEKELWTNISNINV